MTFSVWPHPKRPQFGNRPYSVNPRARRIDKAVVVPKGHTLCPECKERHVARNAARCFRCAGLSPEMLELEAVIASGRTEPRLTLAEFLHSNVTESTDESAEVM